jgi:membrane associated rhomboid family serine protease
VNATSTRIGADTLVAMATCYRHPDRETGLSCTDCGRAICTECMTMTPVGPRCPDHAFARPATAPRQRVRRVLPQARGVPVVTWGLIAANVLVYLITVAQGGGINDPGGNVFTKGLLFGPAVADGDWWRLITSAFLHANLIHIALNMLAVYWLGAAVELSLGPVRYLALYLVSGLSGAAGALLANPVEPTVGASGAIFGILGALLVIEYQQTGRLAGPALTLIAINLLFTFSVANISYGGHLGGLAGGILVAAAFARFGRGHIAYGRPGVVGVAGLVAVAALSIAISYWKVRGYA